jgi:hypothetical protein
MRYLAAAVVLLLAVGAAPVRADEGFVEINLAAGMSVEDFLRAAGTVSGLRLVWDESDKAIRGQAYGGPGSLRLRPAALLPTLRALLATQDLVLIPIGPREEGVHEVADIRASSVILRMKPVAITLTEENLEEYAGQDGLFVSAVLEGPRTADLLATRNALQRLVTPQNIGSVVEILDARAFLVTDFAPTVVAIYRALRQIDGVAAPAAEGPAFRHLRLAHAEAVRVAEILSTQFGAHTDPSRPSGYPAASPSLRIQGDPRTNTVLFSGPAATVERAIETARLLDADLDAPASSAATPTGSAPDPALERLHSTRVTLLAESAAVEEVLDALRKATGLQIVVTPSAFANGLSSAEITLRADGIPASRVLDLVCPMGDAGWEVQEGIVYLTDCRGR